MPEWTAEVISWVCGAGGLGLILGWLAGRLGGGRVPSAEFESLVTQERSLRNELRDTKAHQAAVDDELRGLRNRNLTLEGELDASQRIAGEAREEAASLAHRDLNLHELEGINASLGEELEAARIRYAELHGQQTQLAAELADATARIETYDNETGRLSGELETAQQRAAALAEENATISTDLGVAAARVADLEQRTTAAADGLYLARARVSEVEGKLAAALSALRTASGDLSEVQAGINAGDLASIVAPARPEIEPVLASNGSGSGASNGSSDGSTNGQTLSSTSDIEPIDDSVFEVPAVTASNVAADAASAIDVTDPIDLTVDSSDFVTPGVDAAAEAADAAANRSNGDS